MGVRCSPISRVSKRSSHPEVNQENQTAFEPKNQILAAPVDRRDPLARELRSHLCGIDGPRQPGVEDLDIVEPATDQPRFEARPYSLDFGQLGHRVGSVAPGVEPAPEAGGAQAFALSS
jgi:hypothetical protein